MAPLCREFCIARKTGYKIFNRYKGSGIEGLAARSGLCIRSGLWQRWHFQPFLRW
jgi:hypothetical protein